MNYNIAIELANFYSYMIPSVLHLPLFMATIIIGYKIENIIYSNLHRIQVGLPFVGFGVEVIFFRVGCCDC